MSDDENGQLPDEHFETVPYYDRLYHQLSVDTNTYYVPADQDECRRLQLMHEIFRMLFDDRLVFPEARIPRLRRVLDCGTGAASWAVDVATRYPECERKIPDFVPPNSVAHVSPLGLLGPKGPHSIRTSTSERDFQVDFR
ncbi:hypothetical protein BJ170DRAFT_592322 [Xylariales sp. AK1849]|nr:hypothetical protein BJ170DRAFT_592322 [Xylariales sp. AK1849]